MSAYLDESTAVLRSAEPRTAESDNGGNGGNREIEQRTRFTVTAVPYPVGGAGECPECRAADRISQAIGEVRYRSSVFRSRQHDAVCLPCLPYLLGILASERENPLTVALYSPAAGDRSAEVLELNAEREDLVVQLVVVKSLEKDLDEPLESITTVLQSQFAAFSAQLRKIAEAS